MFGNHGLGGLLEEGGHEKSPKCLGGNLGDFGEFCKGLKMSTIYPLLTHIAAHPGSFFFKIKKSKTPKAGAA